MAGGRPWPLRFSPRTSPQFPANSETNANDFLGGTRESDTISGLAGDDEIYGYAGDDWLYGGSGNDYVDGGYNNDHLYGDDGSDELHGGAGDDWLYGGNGSDELYGGAGADHLYAGSGYPPGSASTISAAWWSNRARPRRRRIIHDPFRRSWNSARWEPRGGRESGTEDRQLSRCQ
jgi:hypothetical protein